MTPTDNDSRPTSRAAATARLGWREVVRTARNPKRVRAVVDPVARQRVARPFRRAVARPVGAWEQDGGWGRRRYDSYAVYVEHQRSKLQAKNLDGYEARFEEALTERLRSVDLAVRGAKVLCLAARLGAEVRAFRSLGAFAIGIDLNPGEGNRWVVHGDFHALDFGDDSVDLVYSNSLDHALELDRVLAEVGRVLHPNGRLLVEVMQGVEEGGTTGQWEATAWPTVDAFVAAVSAAGFTLTSRTAIDVPWNGELLALGVTGSGEDPERIP